MGRLDDIINDLTKSKISSRQFVRRAAALGLSIPALSLGFGHKLSHQTDSNRSPWPEISDLREVDLETPPWSAILVEYLGAEPPDSPELEPGMSGD